MGVIENYCGQIKAEDESSIYKHKLDKKFSKRSKKERFGSLLLGCILTICKNTQSTPCAEIKPYDVDSNPATTNCTWLGRNNVAGRLAASAMVLTTVVSGNLLGACGLLYSSDGGNGFEKIHPASYLLYLSLAILCLSRRGLGARIMELASRETELAIAISAFSATTVLTLCVQGSGAAVILLDTFLPAVCAALSFLAGGYEYRRKLRVLLLACLLGNAAIAVIETCLQVNFIPAADAEFIDRPEFRAMALFDHPLTGASAELMSLIMILRSNWSFFPKFLALITTMAALCAFGGRVALGLALVTLIHSVTSITPSRKAVYSTALSLVVAMLICSMSFFSIEKFTSRALNHFYWDSSAQVRIVQFLIVAKLNTTEIFFGCRRSDLFRIIEQSYLQDSVGVVRTTGS